MNCCEYNCDQGRDCPARVAKCKPVMRAAEPLPPSTWRADMKFQTWWMILLAMALPYIPMLVYLVLRE